MPTNDMTFKIGGEAGQGLESSGAGFASALARGGLRVFAVGDYRSRIRGGHNHFQIRISDDPLWSPNEPVHLLLALTTEAVASGRRVSPLPFASLKEYISLETISVSSPMPRLKRSVLSRMGGLIS